MTDTIIKITNDCYKNRDSQDYLAACGHEGHFLDRCNIGGCFGVIVLQDGNAPEVCESCRDAGHTWE
jgi:hypothetical protein